VLLLDGELAIAEPKRLRTRLLHTAGRVLTHARRLTLHLPGAWPWAPILAAGVHPAVAPAATPLTTAHEKPRLVNFSPTGEPAWRSGRVGS